MKIVVLLPDGVSIRNFVLSPFLPLLAKRAEVYLWHVIPDESVASYGRGTEAVWQPLLNYRERRLPFVLRSSMGYAHMYRGATLAMRYNLAKPTKGSWKTRAKYAAVRMLGRAMAHGGGVGLLERSHVRAVGRALETGHYREILRRLKPSLVFSCDQRSLEIVPPVIAARELGIPTATFIFSWDNLTSKSRIAVPFEHYLIWSSLMRSELLQFYPTVPVEQTHIVGTPQFDAYADPRILWPREEFFARIGADPGRPLICYSGGDTVTCPDDPRHLEVLAEAVQAGQIHGRPQVLLRPSPVDDGRRYEPVLRRHKDLICSLPNWSQGHSSEWTKVIPRPDDVTFLANLTEHADLNVNVASTMTLDFAIHDKPVVNIAFDVSDPPPYGIPLWEWHYRKEHYRPVVEFGAARVARSPEELAEHVNDCLARPHSDAAGRRKLVELQLGAPVGDSSQTNCRSAGGDCRVKAETPEPRAATGVGCAPGRALPSALGSSIRRRSANAFAVLAALLFRRPVERQWERGAATARYLEFGSGRGTTSMYLASRKCPVTMVDLSPERISVGANQF